MNTRDEIFDAMDGRRLDVPPPAIFTQTGTLGQMEHCGCFWPEANSDAGMMAELALQPHMMFGFATVRVPFCITVPAQAFGAVVNPGNKGCQPSILSSPYLGNEVPDVPDDLPSGDDFLSFPGVCTVLDAAEILSKREDVFVVSSLTGPSAVANDLLGMENVLMGLLLEDPRVPRWFDAVSPAVDAYALALSERSDAVVVIDEASTDVISPDLFCGYVAERLEKTVAEAGRGAYSVIHSCGSTVEVLEKLVTLGEDALSPQASDCMEEYAERTADRVRLLGSVDPVGVLLMGGPEDVRKQARRSAEAGFDIVTPECGVAPQTPDRNLLALSEYRG